MTNKLLKENNILKKDFSLSFLFFIFIFFQIYGHRYDLLDLTMILTIFLFIIIGFPKYKFPASTEYFSLLYLLTAIIFYACFTQIVNYQFDLYLSGRLFRMMLSMFLLPVIILVLRPDIKFFFKIYIICTLIHCICLLLQIYDEARFLPLFGIYTGVTENNYILHGGQILNNRGFGLANSYDKAGLFICFNIIFNAYLYFNEKNNSRYILIILFTFLCGIFTGRTFMIVGTILTFLVLMLIIIRSKNFLHQLFLAISIFLIYAYVIVSYYPIIKATFIYTFTGEIISSINITAAGIYGQGFYIGSFNEILSFFKLPDSYWSFLFGGELIREGVDSGIIKILLSTGIIGLLLHLFFYYRLALFYHHHSLKYQFSLIIIPLYLLIFVYDLKDNNIFTKNVTELLIILAIIFLINKKNDNRNSTSFTRL
mgnify:CR=1 FL=1